MEDDQTLMGTAGGEEFAHSNSQKFRLKQRPEFQSEMAKLKA